MTKNKPKYTIRVYQKAKKGKVDDIFFEYSSDYLEELVYLFRCQVEKDKNTKL